MKFVIILIFLQFFFGISALPLECLVSSPAPSVATNATAFQCPATINSTLTQYLRQIFVDKHNQLRSILAQGKSQLPDGSFAASAGNMLKMEYSCELEKVAQEWADNCQWQHSPANHRQGGENLYAIISATSGAGQYLRQAIEHSNDAWWDELKQYGGISSTNVTLTMDAFNRGIGHWTQMAWATTRTIGCGFRECPRGDGTMMHFVVCNYRPMGNYLNQNIYSIAPSCSQCSSSASASACEVSTGLCRV